MPTYGTTHLTSEWTVGLEIVLLKINERNAHIWDYLFNV